MKWIKTRKNFLNEALIKDVILPRQAALIEEEWGSKFLDYDEVDPTDKIKQGKWKLSESDKNLVLSNFFECDMAVVFRTFEGLPDKFSEILNQSIITNTDLSNDKINIVFKNFDIRKPTIDQIIMLFDNIFRKLSVSETISNEVIKRDESGRPIKDDDGKMIKVAKEPGVPVFSSNLVNINSFCEDFNRCYPNDEVYYNEFNKSDIKSIRNLGTERSNDSYDIDFDIFDKDIYLSISHNPKDILNMSISKFYTSCQHLYGGGYNQKVLSNVFDPNSIPAFLIFETPIFEHDEKISEHLPLCRMVIRNIETYNDGDVKIFFDRSYPDRMKDIFGKIVEKYSGNIENADQSMTYLFTPDIDTDDNLEEPYMDRLDVKRGNYIGKNIRTLYLNRNSDWSKFKISPNNKVRELVIETTDLPKNFFDLNLNLDWIKFKFLILDSLGNFGKIKTKSLSFDKCKFNWDILSSSDIINEVVNLKIITCDIDKIDLSNFKGLTELDLIYTLDRGQKLSEIIGDIKLKKLVISGDLLSDVDNKNYINSIKSRGVKVEVKGPVI